MVSGNIFFQKQVEIFDFTLCYFEITILLFILLSNAAIMV